jgi:hypothetical protein
MARAGQGVISHRVGRCSLFAWNSIQETDEAGCPLSIYSFEHSRHGDTGYWAESVESLGGSLNSFQRRRRAWSQAADVAESRDVRTQGKQRSTLRLRDSGQARDIEALIVAIAPQRAQTGITRRVQSLSIPSSSPLNLSW